MTIGFDASRAFVAGRTGTENYSYQLLKALAKIDTENDYLIYITKTQKSKLKSQNWPQNFTFKTINFKFLWTQIGLAGRTFIDPVDVLFVPSHTLPLIRRPGLKTVITVHDLGAEYLPGLHQLKQVLYLKLMTHYQLKTASRIIAVSEATKKDLVKKVGVPSEKMKLPWFKNHGFFFSGRDFGSKIKVVHEGVEKNIFKKISKEIINDIVKKYDLEREKYFLFVGTIQPRKNIVRLISAFKKFLDLNISLDSQDRLMIKDKQSLRSNDLERLMNMKRQKSVISNQQSLFRLILVGQKGWKSESIYALPEKLGINDNIRFLGRISDEDLAGLYNGAAALVYPSLFEGFGLPIIEAFACGCPVITSDVSSMPEVAGKAALLVDPEKEEEIAAGMLKIIKNDPLREDLIQKGYNRVKEFDWEKTASETVKIFKEAKRA